MADKPIMAQAFGEAVGASKRQIQFWTVHGAIKCLAKRHPGRGRQRFYDEAEMPIARLVAQMAVFELPIGRLVSAAEWIRVFTNPEGPGTYSKGPTKGLTGGFTAAELRDALAGKHESFILLRPGIDSFLWLDRKGMNRALKGSAMIVIPVHEVVTHGPQTWSPD